MTRQRPEPYIEEMRHQMDLEDQLPPEGSFFHICRQCGGVIEWDEVDSEESEYIETEEGYMHAECAIEYFREYVIMNKKKAHWKGKEE